ncbi:GNAT family N-acetyltransferase [Salinarchaeum laminariae]|uniref:GNAT family N-acetyltransferase n=1 Tax=Salinarchaeum laminariae TaxID=869888 RepID=UPI0020BFD2F3|nr:GNAT family N-acetyltransferase [Salinarchaeum laminariae]
MTLRRPLEFDHDDRKVLYEYVEEHGSVAPDEAQTDCLPHDPGGFRHHVAILRRNGHLERTPDGQLQVAIDTDEVAEEFDREEVSFRVRPARQADLTGIVGAMRQVVEDGSYIVAETVAQEVDHDQALLRHNELESRMFFVATVDDEVVGWVHLRSPELAKLAHTAELTVGVLEEYRDNGIGSHLLQRGLEWAASRGFEKVYQSLPATNEEAIAFLEGHGWAIEAVREDHYVIDGDYVDETMLAVDL